MIAIDDRRSTIEPVPFGPGVTVALVMVTGFAKVKTIWWLLPEPAVRYLDPKTIRRRKINIEIAGATMILREPAAKRRKEVAGK